MDHRILRSSLLFFMLLTASSALNWKFEYNGYQYHFTEQKLNQKNWYDARAECMAEGGDLVTIETADEDTWLTERDVSYSSNFWIGLNNLNRAEKWEWADWKTSSLDNWVSNEPRDNELCAYKVSVRSKLWYSENCGQEKAYICKRPLGVVTPKTTEATKPVGGFCPSGWVDPGTDRCYKVYGPLDKSIRWADAQALCRELNYRATDLACANTQEEVSTLTILGAQRPREVSMWIGLYRTYYNLQNWKWSDNTVVGVSNFHDAYYQNDDGCGFISSALKPPGSWDVDGTCTLTKNAYICQILKDPNNVIPTPGVTPPNSCKNDYVPFENSCYKMVTEQQTYEQAVQTCFREGASIADIHSAAENAFVQLTIGQTRAVWIGLKYNSQDREYEWNNRWYVNYVNWGPGQPKLEAGGGCVYIQGSDAFWFDSSCTESHPTLCKTTTDPPFTHPPEVDGRCPNREWYPYGRHCYYVKPRTVKNWISTTLECSKTYKNAKTVSIHDKATDTKIHDLIFADYTLGDSWLGLFISSVTGDWTWSDGTPVQYTNWAPGEPPTDPSSEKRCAYIEMIGTKAGMWVTSLCTYTRGQLCQIEKIPHLTTPVPVLGNCPSEEWRKYGAHCYLFRPDEFQSWSGAKGVCQEEGGVGATMAHSDNWSENDYIQHNMRQISHLPIDRNFWIGLTKDERGTNYIWDDGSKLKDFEHWGASQPSDTVGKDCVQINIANSMWRNEKCDDLMGYACRISVLSGPNNGSRRWSISSLLIFICNIVIFKNMFPSH